MKCAYVWSSVLLDDLIILVKSPLWMIGHHSYNQCLYLSSSLTLHYCLLNYLLLGKELQKFSKLNTNSVLDLVIDISYLMLDFVRFYWKQPLANDYLEDCYHLFLFSFWVYLYVRRQLSLTQRVVLSQKNI